MRRRYALKIFPAGAAICFLMTVPVVNLFAPILGAAAMTHVYKGLEGRRLQQD